MSEGPIKREREAFGKRDAVSTPDAHRVCFRVEGGAGYCGRLSAKVKSGFWGETTCSDCRAAARADGKRVPVEVPAMAEGAA